MHVVIIANGVIADCAAAREIAAGADCLMCADGGTRYALEWNLTPDVVIGDMDSVEPAHLERLKQAGAEIIRHPARKDETDLELALEWAAGAGATEITVVGALGGRLDQTLGNILLLTWERLAGIRVRIVEGPEQLFVARPGTLTLRGRPGDTVSLLPLSPEVAGIVTSGLEYPLRGESLHMGPGRGISNVLAGDEASIRFTRGLLAVTHRRA